MEDLGPAEAPALSGSSASAAAIARASASDVPDKQEVSEHDMRKMLHQKDTANVLKNNYAIGVPIRALFTLAGCRDKEGGDYYRESGIAGASLRNQEKYPNLVFSTLLNKAPRCAPRICVRGNSRAYGKPAMLGDFAGDKADALNVKIAVLAAKTQLRAQMLADMVAIQHSHVALLITLR